MLFYTTRYAELILNPTKFFVHENIILSREGTTHGDPLPMAMYGLAILPLIKLVNDNSSTQKRYADDGNAVGKLESLQRALDNFIKQ